jgi:hypothetical protein
MVANSSSLTHHIVPAVSVLPASFCRKRKKRYDAQAVQVPGLAEKVQERKMEGGKSTQEAETTTPNIEEEDEPLG